MESLASPRTAASLPRAHVPTIASPATGYAPAGFRRAYAHITLAAIERCQYCVANENDLPIVVASSPTSSDPLRQ